MSPASCQLLHTALISGTKNPLESRLIFSGDTFPAFCGGALGATSLRLELRHQKHYNARIFQLANQMSRAIRIMRVFRYLRSQQFTEKLNCGYAPKPVHGLRYSQVLRRYSIRSIKLVTSLDRRLHPFRQPRYRRIYF